jgi:hypothetical protein
VVGVRSGTPATAMYASPIVLIRSQRKCSTIRSKDVKTSFSSAISAPGSREMAISVNPTKSSISTDAEGNDCGVVVPKSFSSS